MRTAQEDLNLALYARPRGVPADNLRPRDNPTGFYVTQRAFNLADKYQVPVFVLTDQYFIDTYYNVPALDLEGIEVEKAFIKTGQDYLRYQFTDTGISPRGVPGYGEGMVRTTSDEHYENAQITEDLLYTRPKWLKSGRTRNLPPLCKLSMNPSL